MNGKWGYVSIFAVMALTPLFTSNRVIAAPTNAQVLYAFCNSEGLSCTDEQIALGRVPQGVVAGPDGAYYGTTALVYNDFYAGGAVYRADPVTRKLSVLYQFPKDYYPTAWLKADPDGYLYGGYVHRIDESNDWLSEGLFRLSPAGEFTVILDETQYRNFVCNAPVRDSLGNWVGITGKTDLPASNPIIYKISAGGGFKVLRHIHSSTDCPNYEPVLAADGNLYGVIADFSGADDVLYRLAPDDTFTILHFFDYDTQGVARTPLTLGPDGALYGALYFYGGSMSTLYRMSLDGQYTDLGAFGPKNFGPTQKLTLMPDGQFFGSGVASDPRHHYPDVNVIFRLSPAGEYTQLSINDRDAFGYSTMIRGFDNALYGTSPIGGKYYGGTLFRYVPPPVL